MREICSTFLELQPDSAAPLESHTNRAWSYLSRSDQNVLHKQQQLSHSCVSMSVAEESAFSENLGVQRVGETWAPFTGLQPDSAAPLESIGTDPNVRGALLLDLNVHVCLIVCYEAALHSDDLHSAASCVPW